MISLWHHVYGEDLGVLALFSGIRSEPNSKTLKFTREAYYAWPTARERARAWVIREAAAGRETYCCAHLLTARRRVKENATPVRTLWVDGDGAKAAEGPVEATLIVESSP